MRYEGVGSRTQVAQLSSERSMQVSGGVDCSIALCDDKKSDLHASVLERT